MTVKEYLTQIYDINQRIRRLQQNREQLRAEAYTVKSPALDADRVSISVPGGMENLIARIDHLERDIVAEIGKRVEMREQITHQIEALPNHRHRQILHERYVMCRGWEVIIDNMQLEDRYVYRLHKAALDAFAQIYGFDQ